MLNHFLWGWNLSWFTKWKTLDYVYICVCVCVFFRVILLTSNSFWSKSMKMAFRKLEKSPLKKYSWVSYIWRPIGSKWAFKWIQETQLWKGYVTFFLEKQVNANEVSKRPNKVSDIISCRTQFCKFLSSCAFVFRSHPIVRKFWRSILEDDGKYTVQRYCWYFAVAFIIIIIIIIITIVIIIVRRKW